MELHTGWGEPLLAAVAGSPELAFLLRSNGVDVDMLRGFSTYSQDECKIEKRKVIPILRAWADDLEESLK